MIESCLLNLVEFFFSFLENNICKTDVYLLNLSFKKKVFLLNKLIIMFQTSGT